MVAVLLRIPFVQIESFRGPAEVLDLHPTPRMGRREAGSWLPNAGIPGVSLFANHGHKAAGGTCVFMVLGPKKAPNGSLEIHIWSPHPQPWRAAGGYQTGCLRSAAFTSRLWFEVVFGVYSRPPKMHTAAEKPLCFPQTHPCICFAFGYFQRRLVSLCVCIRG